MHERLDGATLSDRYRGPEMRRRIVDILDLRTFLQECVIRSDYRPSDKLNSSLVLTDYGNWLMRASTNHSKPPQNKISVKVAKLTCLLELYHRDFLLDVSAVDIDALSSAISAEMLAGDILLPFVHGPGLYERAAELFPDRQGWLSTSDTLRLLEGQPVGVFQCGRWLSGPYGLVKSRDARDIQPSLRIPLQHCHDVSCRQVHLTHLSTDSTAEINDARSTIARLLVSEGEEPSEFGSLFAELSDELTDEFDDTSFAGLGFLLGDGFGDGELALILLDLIDNRDLGMRQLVETVARTNLKAAADFVDGLDRAELLQLILLATDQDIAACLERLVFQHEDGIEVPDGEVRRPVLRGLRAGAFHSSIELSSLGLRMSSAAELGPLRLRRLIEDLYMGPGSSDLADPDNASKMDELSWQLREIEGVTPEARLDEYLRSENPESVIRRLVFCRKAHVEKALTSLRMDGDGVDDETLILRMLWKFGFDVSVQPTLHDRFWHLHDRMVHSTRAANVSTIVDQEAIRGIGSSYFVALEHLLSDSLAFTSWTLTSDHVASRRPFCFDGASQLDDGFRVLLVEEGERESPSDGWTLFPLSEAFGKLADILEAAKNERSTYTRGRSTVPGFAGKTKLQLFPFEHSMAFLDLTASSQVSVLGLLRDVRSLLVKSRIFEVRNEQVHYRRSSSGVDKWMHALTHVEAAVKKLEDAGFTRILFHPDRRERDRWGRSTIYFNDRRGREIAIGRPSPFTWLSMPTLSEPQYLILAAQFAEPNEVLRVALEMDSSYRDLWSNFPMRRRKSRTRPSDDPATDTAGAGMNPESVRS